MAVPAAAVSVEGFTCPDGNHCVQQFFLPSGTCPPAPGGRHPLYVHMTIISAAPGDNVGGCAGAGRWLPASVVMMATGGGGRHAASSSRRALPWLARSTVAAGRCRVLTAGSTDAGGHGAPRAYRESPSPPEVRRRWSSSLVAQSPWRRWRWLCVGSPYAWADTPDGGRVRVAAFPARRSHLLGMSPRITRAQRLPHRPAPRLSLIFLSYFLFFLFSISLTGGAGREALYLCSLPCFCGGG